MFNFFSRGSKQPQKLFFETEMHCHLIPGVDDGQATPEGGATLVEKEVKWGIKRIFFTPHITQDTFENSQQAIASAFHLLKTEVDARGIDVWLDYSAEHRLDPMFKSLIDSGNIKPFPNNYLLVENPFIQEAWNFDSTLFELIMKGYNPILAHPERYQYYHNHPDRYKQIHAAGTKFQINLLSLSGFYGKDIKRVAEMLIELNLVDFVGTDMHNERHCESIERYLASGDYRRHAALLKCRIMNDKVL